MCMCLKINKEHLSPQQHWNDLDQITLDVYFKVQAIVISTYNEAMP